MAIWAGPSQTESLDQCRWGQVFPPYRRLATKAAVVIKLQRAVSSFRGNRLHAWSACTSDKHSTTAQRFTSNSSRGSAALELLSLGGAVLAAGCHGQKHKGLQPVRHLVLSCLQFPIQRQPTCSILVPALLWPTFKGCQLQQLLVSTWKGSRSSIPLPFLATQLEDWFKWNC